MTHIQETTNKNCSTTLKHDSPSHVLVVSGMRAGQGIHKFDESV